MPQRSEEEAREDKNDESRRLFSNRERHNDMAWVGYTNYNA